MKKCCFNDPVQEQQSLHKTDRQKKELASKFYNYIEYIMAINTYTNIFIILECHAKAFYILWTLHSNRSDWVDEVETSSQQGTIQNTYPFSTNQRKLYNELLYSLLLAFVGIIILIVNIYKIKHTVNWRKQVFIFNAIATCTIIPPFKIYPIHYVYGNFSRAFYAVAQTACCCTTDFLSSTICIAIPLVYFQIALKIQYSNGDSNQGPEDNQIYNEIQSEFINNFVVWSTIYKCIFGAKMCYYNIQRYFMSGYFSGKDLELKTQVIKELPIGIITATLTPKYDENESVNENINCMEEQSRIIFLKTLNRI